MTLTYDTAQELKAAGFPQVMKDGIWAGGRSGEDHFYIPTLEELIEACPQNYKIADYFEGDFTLDVFNGTWHAGYEHSDGWYEGPEGDGATPAEAVARLWLALNKK